MGEYVDRGSGGAEKEFYMMCNRKGDCGNMKAWGQMLESGRNWR